MKRSSERILTTHTGSLPRPSDLLALLRQKEDGQAVDGGAFAACVRQAVAETVKRQMATGIDIVNDGEMSKPSYATYVKDRLSGFDGSERSLPIRGADMQDFPDYARASAGGMGASGVRMKRPACTGPISYRERAALEVDLTNFKAALAGTSPADTFMSAASPGVVTFFLSNKYYPSHEAYLRAIAEAMRVEYEAIVAAGFVLQVDCPDLAMSRHVHYKDLSLSEFRKTIELHIEALNHALANVPEDRVRVHLCWGNYEGPHNHDVPLRDIIDIVMKARAQGISYEASNPRHEHEWAVFKEVKLPPGKVLIPGVIDSVTNFVEHPELVAQRICNLANVVGRENVIAGTDCGFGTIAGSSAVDPAIAWAKLSSMAEGARLASRMLWH
ncbi:MAG TPA: cobalamin-independent methionine synthase II family protein [Candidatus Binataceae bacterium]|nr:cobalamin-independent methionine synthase II family protein [Candidatus Binataceae bacterium]